MENLADNYKHINGWGIDADPENEPTYPMKKWTGDDHNRLNYERPPLQVPTVEILQSNERPNLTAVIGTSTPPKGLSGMIRRYAFKYSEGSFGHWIPLIIADRVNVIEGIIEDMTHGHFPNIFMERGWDAEWRHNKKNFITTAAIGLGVAALAVTFLTQRSKKKKKEKNAMNFEI